jgi:predicted secreted protein
MNYSSKGRAFVTLVAIIACASAFGLSPSVRSEAATKRVADRVYTDPATPINVQTGQLFLVALATSPGTGHHWKVASAPDAGVAVLRGTAYEASKTGLMGAPGQEIRVYQAMGTGSTTISLNYVSPGSEKTVGKSVQFKVVVAKPGSM